MLKLAVIALSDLRGLIHLSGFAEASEIGGDGGVLAQAISKPVGVVWLLVGMSLLVSVALRACKIRGWPVAALLGAVASQVLVFAHWGDAKWITMANILLIALAAPAIGGWRFGRDTRTKVEALASRATVPSTAASESGQRPPPVTRWLRRSGALDAPPSKLVRLRQRGRMQTTPRGRWMPFTARQWFSVCPPGFVWVADTRAAPAVRLAARDEYAQGRGSMHVLLASLIPVVHAEGPEIDQGSLLRYLAEIIWFPSAALQPYLRWEDEGPDTARVTMTYGGVAADGVFSFNARGDVVRFEAQRYNGDTLQEWLVEVEPDSVATFGCYRIPTRARVTWRGDDGDWTWLELTVEAVEHLDVLGP